jgi:polysaccharide deacetylase family protein (PEP-CTERM system associated)
MPKAKKKEVVNGLSIDVEEWFHVLDVPDSPQPVNWDALPRTVERNTHKILDILEDSHAHATFFVLGWVADRYGNLVREIARRGHEVACHGDRHRLVFQQGRAGLEQDLRRARGLLQDLAGVPVIGYRAPGFSIGPRAPWAFEVIRDVGFRYDSSLFPARRMHGGAPGARQEPHAIELENGLTLVEFPSSVVQVGPLRVPFAGGGYLRLLPYGFIRWGLLSMNARGIPGCVYLHPREIDPAHPRIRMSWSRQFQSYVGLRSTEHKLRQLLTDFRMGRLVDVLLERKLLDAPGAALRRE